MAELVAIGYNSTMGINHFDKACLLVLSADRVGGWVNDPDDPGKETYRDISRRFNPNWEGWAILDKYEKKDNYALLGNEALQKLVFEFYYKEHWSRHSLQDVQDYEMALSIFDCSILCGYTLAPVWAQDCLNVLNDRASLWPDTEVDGWIGAETVGIINLCAQIRKPAFMALYEAMRLSYHIQNAKANVKLEKYMNGWIRRAMANRQG
jgi:lysozyme family protein